MDTQTNLHLRTNSRVSRVIFEGNKAVGVAYVPSRNRAHKGALLETIVRVRDNPPPQWPYRYLTVRLQARKCVVVSAGTLGSPQVKSEL
jgi:alcohol oxidase